MKSSGIARMQQKNPKSTKIRRAIDSSTYRTIAYIAIVLKSLDFHNSRVYDIYQLQLMQQQQQQRDGMHAEKSKSDV